MARPQSDKNDHRNKQVMVRFTESEFDAIHSQAECAGKSLSAYIHQLALDGKVNVRYTLSPQTDELKPILSQLGKTGANLNQIARYYNEGGRETAQLRMDIQRCIADLYDLRAKLVAEWNEL